MVNIAVLLQIIVANLGLYDVLIRECKTLTIITPSADTQNYISRFLPVSYHSTLKKI